MLKYHTIDISCRAIPNEVSLVFNITGCTIKCPGCNERALWKDKGIALTLKEFRSIIQNYHGSITCVCFMGGEHEPQEINMLARYIKQNYSSLRTAWYSGLDEIDKEIDFCNFNYLKIGAYQAFKGALGTIGTNQRVFEVTEDYTLIDITDKYIRTEPDEIRQLDIAKIEEIVEESQEETDDTENSEGEDIQEISEIEALTEISELKETEIAEESNLDEIIEELEETIDSQDIEETVETQEQPSETIIEIKEETTPPNTGVIMEI